MTRGREIGPPGMDSDRPIPLPYAGTILIRFRPPDEPASLSPTSGLRLSRREVS